ncbi:MAG TPA: DinB family protein [Gemmatimonadaceae bacterium]
MHSRLAELSERLAAERRELLDVASGVPADRWQTRPSVERWSVSEILQHLHQVEMGCAGVLSKRITQAREAGHPAERETSSVLGTLDHLGVSQLDRKLVAPERVQPAENPDRETAERRLAESRAALLAALESGDGLALGEIRHTHPRFGELDLYQWCLFVAEHEKRHVTQLREVVAQLAPAP